MLPWSGSYCGGLAHLVAGVASGAQDELRSGNSPHIPDGLGLGIPCLTIRQIYTSFVRSKRGFPTYSRYHKIARGLSIYIIYI